MNIGFGYNAVPSGAEGEILKVFRSGQYSPGERVREFEKKFARLHKAKHGIFVNSGTDALRLSLLAMKEKYGWRDGDKVIVPAMTFVATVNVIVQAGLEPVFADVGPDYTMNVYSVGHDSTCVELEDFWEDERLRAVMPVHLFGQVCGNAVYELAKKYRLKVLEDSCETIANPVKGDISCHSTYMAHHVTTGVGGMALTNDTDLNYLIRSYANHGRNTDYLPGYFSQNLSKKLLKHRFQFDREGYSCRATEFQAVLGLSQLDGLRENIEKRTHMAFLLQNALQYVEELRVTWGVPDPRREHTWMMFPLILKEGDKYDLCLHLEKNGIETRDLMPIVSQPCFAKYFKNDPWSCPNAREIEKKGFYIPCHPGMTVEDVGHIAKTFKSYFSKAVAVA